MAGTFSAGRSTAAVALVRAFWTAQLAVMVTAMVHQLTRAGRVNHRKRKKPPPGGDRGLTDGRRGIHRVASASMTPNTAVTNFRCDQK
jgi:hypothetical protein